MRNWRDTAIAAGFAAFQVTGLHRALAPLLRGRGAILMFHHVRPYAPQAFAPNRLLEITPVFLEGVLELLRARGFDILSLDAGLTQLARPRQPGEKPFVVLTFDDGYRDARDYALPILRRHDAPFTLYITTGFADRTARLWWRELEEAVRRLDSFVLDVGAGPVPFLAKTDQQKTRAFEQAYWLLRTKDEATLLGSIASLCQQADIDGRALVDAFCMGWDEIAAMAQEPLCTIGVHTLSHPRLAKLSDIEARHELVQSRAIIEAQLGRRAVHLSYPIGDATSAGLREFALADELEFQSAVTTRPGMIVDAHASRLTALPRLSINGKWQHMAMVDVLLSGAPFALLNRGRPG